VNSALLACPICGALIYADKVWQETHRAWHARNGDVDEV